MSTSNTVTFQVNRDDLVTAALRLVMSVDLENTFTPTANQLTLGSQALNLLIKQWEAYGLQLWERRYGVIFPQANQGVFVLGSPGPAGDHACLTTPLGVGGFVQTTLASSVAAGATAALVTTTSSNFTVGVPVVTMGSGYFIGIQLDSGGLYWTTINGAPIGNSVTLTAGPPSGASAGNLVYCYQTKLMRPMRVLDGFVRQVSQTNDIPVQIIPRENYNRFGQKTSTGTPVQLYYDPQLNTGNVYIYPQFSTVNQLLYIEFTKPMDDMTTGTDNFDLPQEWGNALKFNLAMILAPEYECPDNKFKQISSLAAMYLDLSKGYDQEAASVYIMPNNWMYDGTFYGSK